MFWSRGRHAGGWGSGCAGGEEGMWAVGVVGTLLWMANAVKAQKQTEQEGTPPNADPGGSAENLPQLEATGLEGGGAPKNGAFDLCPMAACRFRGFLTVCPTRKRPLNAWTHMKRGIETRWSQQTLHPKGNISMRRRLQHGDPSGHSGFNKPCAPNRKL